MTTPISKRTTAPAFQVYAAEFISGEKVSRMSYTEVGIFTVLLMHSWLANGLPKSVTEIAKILKLNPKRFEKIWAGVLSECFVLKGERLVNPRQERERKKQAEYRRRQTDKANARWQSPGNATALPERHQPGNALQSLSSSSSPKKTYTQGAPIHSTHKNHAACGRVCVPADLHGKFVRALNRDDADAILRGWYTEIDNVWSVGSEKDTPTGSNDYTFWRARFDERWPAVNSVTVPDRRLPAWARS